MAEPHERLEALFERTRGAKLPEPTAVTLATVDADGRPRARVVACRGLDATGLVFYTNLESDKAIEISAAPDVALCFYWQLTDEQVRVEGRAEPVTEAEADAYWASRSRESQMGGWASDQSRPLESAAVLIERVQHFAHRFKDGPVPRPPHWSGYRVVPRTWEFWKRGEGRLHDRVRYERTAEGWSETLLNP